MVRWDAYRERATVLNERQRSSNVGRLVPVVLGETHGWHED